MGRIMARVHPGNHNMVSLTAPSVLMRDTGQAAVLAYGVGTATEVSTLSWHLVGILGLS